MRIETGRHNTKEVENKHTFLCKVYGLFNELDINTEEKKEIINIKGIEIRAKRTRL